MRTNRLLPLLAVLVLSACQQGQASGTADTERLLPKPVVEPIDPVKDPLTAMKARKQQMAEVADLTSMRAEIMALIGEARADNVQQCRVAGFGSKPCGGPASYIAYSLKDKNETVLLALIEKYNSAAKAENERLGLMSDCAIVPKPAVVLENGVCTLKTGTDTASY
ncbi:hypothetical protein MN202_04275 [Rheinheimera muenzenbergensis]|uniref:Lipoprotein n=1 Tax=Rheinheimera muenzenbergensis TaxID=1193628 RepID=A0ABU8C3F0_9GAMM